MSDGYLNIYRIFKWRTARTFTLYGSTTGRAGGLDICGKVIRYPIFRKTFDRGADYEN